MNQISSIINNYTKRRILKKTHENKYGKGKKRKGKDVVDSDILDCTKYDSKHCDTTIRQIALSKNNQWMICVCEDSSICCWKLENNDVEMIM